MSDKNEAIQEMTPEQKRLVTCNIKMMDKFVKRALEMGKVPLYMEDEFLSDIYLGFCKSAIGYSPEFGFKFSTYAYGGFEMNLRGVCSRKKEKYHKNNFLPFETITKIVDSYQGKRSQKHSKKMRVKDIISESPLNKKELYVITNHFFEKQTISFISNELGMSRQGTYLLLKKAINKIRKTVFNNDISLQDFQLRQSFID